MTPIERIKKMPNRQNMLDDINADRTSRKIRDLESRIVLLQLREKQLLHAISLIDPSMDFKGWESAEGEPIGDLINSLIRNDLTSS